MPDPIARELLRRHPESPAEALGIDLAEGDPGALFRWLVVSLLVSAPISARLAFRAAEALFEAGMTTPKRMAEADWEDRVAALNGAGYGRLDEKTSTQLGELAEKVLDDWDGDLNRLREDAGGALDALRERLTAFKGIGKVGAEVFLREAQRAWPEIRPFADAKALEAARRLELAEDAEQLAEKAGSEEDLPRLLAALVAADLAGELDEVAEAAFSWRSPRSA